jgi:glucose 1-dehydrogenase
MKAVIVDPKKGRFIDLRDLPAPEPAEAEVLVRTLSVGIDATDHDVYQATYGEPPPGERFLVAGHEAVGRVEAAGGRAKDLTGGDFVVPTVRRSCAGCEPCDNNQPDMCRTENYGERGIKGIHGFLSELFIEKPENLVKIPADLVRYGSLIEPLSIVEKAVTQAFKIQERLAWTPETALVLGAGPLGLLATVSLAQKGISTFTLDIVDEDSPKARVVNQAGAAYINGRQIDLADVPSAYRAPDIILEATGQSEVAFGAISILNPTGVMCFLSVTAGERKATVCTDCLNDALVLGNKAIFGSVSSNRLHFGQAIDTLTAAHKADAALLPLIVNDPLDLSSYKKAFENNSDAIKSVIYLAHP